ncbi:MAG: hypothetical protein CVT98_09750 [Bacteroidetes bacterium HGW-Bacteroidetes-15]|nr:MAG: hypothetical protein CVT98_09750 [Bacteroidetes bacterium HGW-Bacteroidetes-15]
MRKLLLGAAMLLLAQLGFGQAVNESAIIPVSVTLNAVSRLNIESGGNIKFVFTSINDYNTGFTGETDPIYRTTVSVASSRNFSVSMYSEAANFLPTDNAANTLAIENLEYQLDWTGTALAPTTYTSAWAQMDAASALVIDNTTDGDGGLAGDGAANRFDIQWRIGTAANSEGTLLSQGDIAADHYVANIFIELIN